jgi:predicted ATPase
MRIRAIRIENFRSFRDETVYLNRYSCFVGPNGAGKSNVMAALNVFFRDSASLGLDVSRLVDEDFFHKNTSNPIRVTVTFCDLSPRATEDLKAYVRNSELVVVAEAHFDASVGSASLKHFGSRPVMEEFRRYFEAEKNGAKVADLKNIYVELRHLRSELPGPGTKDAMAEALRNFEAAHPELCTLIPSEDNFYGVAGAGKLSPFIQWVYVPAVKDVGEEAEEAKNTALTKLVARVVRGRTNFETALETLKAETLRKYSDLLSENRSALNDLSQSLRVRLEEWAHPNINFSMDWLSDAKSVTVAAPIAGIRTGEDDFSGSMSRMGHGLQRSYFLALLQELTSSDLPDAPTLILGIEEPELYQHPPQARHLAEVLNQLAVGNSQILATTHSPYFVSGEGFEDLRLTRKVHAEGTKVSHYEYSKLCARLREVQGEATRPNNTGLIAKIHQALQPNVAEMFFARLPILVEGLEDIAYITTWLHLTGEWQEFRRLGCHLVAVNGKDKLIKPLSIAKGLLLPVFVIFDADGNQQSRPDQKKHHENDNKALLTLLGSSSDIFPSATVLASDHAVWPENIGASVKADIPAEKLQPIQDQLRVTFAHESGLEKQELFIAEWLCAVHSQSIPIPTLSNLCQTILCLARTLVPPSRLPVEPVQLQSTPATTAQG